MGGWNDGLEVFTMRLKCWVPQELAAAPLELLLKEVKEEPDDRPDEQVDQPGP